MAIVRRSSCGNHMNEWVVAARTRRALSRFIVDTHERDPDVPVHPRRWISNWMEAQDPAVLAELQNSVAGRADSVATDLLPHGPANCSRFNVECARASIHCCGSVLRTKATRFGKRGGDRQLAPPAAIDGIDILCRHGPAGMLDDSPLGHAAAGVAT